MHATLLELQLERSIVSGTPSSRTVLRTAIQLSVATEGLEPLVVGTKRLYSSLTPTWGGKVPSL
jgi:hypothetical protein